MIKCNDFLHFFPQEYFQSIYSFIRSRVLGQPKTLKHPTLAFYGNLNSETPHLSSTGWKSSSRNVLFHQSSGWLGKHLLSEMHNITCGWGMQWL